MDKSKNYLDLSKCTEEERKHVFSLLPHAVFLCQYKIESEQFKLHLNNNEWWVLNHGTSRKTELTYPEFIKLFNHTVQEDMICPVNKNHCDDECCTIGSTCNLSGNHNLKPSDPNELKNPELFEGEKETEVQKLKKQIDLYKECFELFIPIEKWDEANEFLSINGNPLAKHLSRVQKEVEKKPKF